MCQETALRRTIAAKPRCPAISDVVLKDEHGTVINLEQACALNFVALEDQARPDLDEPTEPDGFFLQGEISELKSDLRALKEKYTALEQKVNSLSGDITFTSFSIKFIEISFMICVSGSPGCRNPE